MPDISMCVTAACPSFNKCYRAQAVPTPYEQAYMDFQPDPEIGRCESYLPPQDETKQND